MAPPGLLMCRVSCEYLGSTFIIDPSVLSLIFDFDCSSIKSAPVRSLSLGRFCLLFLRWWIAVWPVVFSLVLFIYLLIYVNLCLSHPIWIDVWNSLCRFNTSYAPFTVYNQLMLWQLQTTFVPHFGPSSDENQARQVTRDLSSTGWCLAQQPVLKH